MFQEIKEIINNENKTQQQLVFLREFLEGFQFFKKEFNMLKNSPQVIWEICQRIKYQRVAENKVIFSQDDKQCDQAYIVINGAVDIRIRSDIHRILTRGNKKDRRAHQERYDSFHRVVTETSQGYTDRHDAIEHLKVMYGKIVRTMEKGELFGEIALLQEHARSASAVAANECELMVIMKQDFMLIKNHLQQLEYSQHQMIDTLFPRLHKQITSWSGIQSIYREFQYYNETFRRNQVIVGENREIDKMNCSIFIVVQGNFTVEQQYCLQTQGLYNFETTEQDYRSKVSRKEKELIVSISELGTGELFGEECVMDQIEYYTFTVRCLSEGAEVLRFQNYSVFKQLPPFILDTIVSICQVKLTERKQLYDKKVDFLQKFYHFGENESQFQMAKDLVQKKKKKKKQKQQAAILQEDKYNFNVDPLHTIITQNTIEIPKENQKNLEIKSLNYLQEETKNQGVFHDPLHQILQDNTNKIIKRQNMTITQINQPILQLKQNDASIFHFQSKVLSSQLNRSEELQTRNLNNSFTSIANSLEKRSNSSSSSIRPLYVSFTPQNRQNRDQNDDPETPSNQNRVNFNITAKSPKNNFNDTSFSFNQLKNQNSSSYLYQGSFPDLSRSERTFQRLGSNVDINQNVKGSARNFNGAKQQELLVPQLIYQHSPENSGSPKIQDMYGNLHSGNLLNQNGGISTYKYFKNQKTHQINQLLGSDGIQDMKRLKDSQSPFRKYLKLKIQKKKLDPFPFQDFNRRQLKILQDQNLNFRQVTPLIKTQDGRIDTTDIAQNKMLLNSNIHPKGIVASSNNTTMTNFSQKNNQTFTINQLLQKIIYSRKNKDDYIFNNIIRPSQNTDQLSDNMNKMIPPTFIKLNQNSQMSMKMDSKIFQQNIKMQRPNDVNLNFDYLNCDEPQQEFSLDQFKNFVQTPQNKSQEDETQANLYPNEEQD